MVTARCTRRRTMFSDGRWVPRRVGKGDMWTLDLSGNRATHLVAVSASSNRPEERQAPTTWKPPDRTAWCWYARAWLTVKTRWVLAASRPMRAPRSLRCTRAVRKNAALYTTPR